MSDPTVKAVEAKFRKAGFGPFQGNDRNNFRWAQAGDAIVDFIAQGERAVCLRVRRSTDKDDSMSDYSAGSFASSITQALRFASHINTGRWDR